LISAFKLTLQNWFVNTEILSNHNLDTSLIWNFDITPALDLQPLFTTRKQGQSPKDYLWLGSDCATSIPVDNKFMIWLF